MTRSALVMLLGLAGCKGDDPAPTQVDPQPTGDTGTALACDDVSWESTGQPFLSTWCTACHSSELASGERFGAPVGIDFDTYADVLALAALVEASAVGSEARMPPVGGGSDDDKALFGRWLACGLPGAPDEPDSPCADAVTADWGASVCASGDPVRIEGDVVADGTDGSCVCEVTGHLTVAGGDGLWTRLAVLGGDLIVDGGSIDAPVLGQVGHLAVRSAGANGEVRLPRLTQAVSVDVESSDLMVLDLHDLETVDHWVSIVGNSSLTYLDLSRLESVGADLVLDDNDALPTVVGELYGLRDVGGDLRIAGHAAWQGFYGCGLLESVGGELQIVENGRFGIINGFTALTSVGSSVRIVSNPALQFLEGFDQLSTIGGEFVVAGNPILTYEDAFGLLERVEGAVVVSANPALVEVSGLVGVHDVGGVVWSDNRNVADLGPYADLTQLRGDLSIRLMGGLQALYGFEQLEVIEGRFVVETNAGLQGVGGFGTLRTVVGDVEVRNHPQLSGLTGLIGVDSVGGSVRVINNPQLSEAAVQSWVDGASVSGDVELSGNGL